MREVVRTVVFDVHGKLLESFKRMEALLVRAEASDDVRAQVMAVGEMRRHIELAARTMELALQTEALLVFQAGVLDALADEGVSVRKRVMELFEARAVGEVKHEDTNGRRKGAAV